jgi:hypothetical protein
MHILNVFYVLQNDRNSNTSTHHFILHAIFAHCIKLTCNNVCYTAVPLPTKMTVLTDMQRKERKRFRLFTFATRVAARMVKDCRCRHNPQQISRRNRGLLEGNRSENVPNMRSVSLTSNVMAVTEHRSWITAAPLHTGAWGGVVVKALRY